MDIIQRLNMLGQAAERRVPCLNMGGCAVYAALVGRALLNQGYRVQGVVHDTFADTADLRLNDVRKLVNGSARLDDWNAYGIDFGHVGLRLEYANQKFNYDSHGVSKDLTRLGRFDNVFRDTLPIADIEAVAAIPANWNRAFNRKSGIPAIKRLVREYLE